MPESMRIVEPELPASKDRAAACNPFNPTPVIETVTLSDAIGTPISRRQASVEPQSAPVEKFSRRLTPSAIAASIA